MSDPNLDQAYEQFADECVKRGWEVNQANFHILVKEEVDRLIKEGKIVRDEDGGLHPIRG